MKRLLLAYEEDLVSLDELRGRMPEPRRREKSLTGEMESLENQSAHEEIYLKLAENLEGFCARLRNAAACSSVLERRQVLRLVVREVLVDTDSVVIRHTIPGLDHGGNPSCHLWGYRHCGHSPTRSDRQNPRMSRPAVSTAAACTA